MNYRFMTKYRAGFAIQGQAGLGEIEFSFEGQDSDLTPFAETLLSGVPGAELMYCVEVPCDS